MKSHTQILHENVQIYEYWLYYQNLYISEYMADVKSFVIDRETNELDISLLLQKGETSDNSLIQTLYILAVVRHLMCCSAYSSPE